MSEIPGFEFILNGENCWKKLLQDLVFWFGSSNITSV